MNSDTKKKIEDADTHACQEGDNGDAGLSFEQGAGFGYQLALQDAEVLVKALENIKLYSKGNMNKDADLIETIAKRALEQWKKVTDEK